MMDSMNETFRRLAAVLMIAGLWGFATYAQTGPKIIPRDTTSASIHEGLSGERSAGVKTDVNPGVGTVSASFSPFRSIRGAIGSLVAPFGAQAPVPSNPATVGFRYMFSQLFFSPTQTFSLTNRIERLFDGTKGIGGKNVTDVARLGQPGGKNPGDPYWIAYPRPGNVENPVAFQTLHHQYDCFCRWDEQVYCPIQQSPFWNVRFGAPQVPPHFAPVPCQVCFGVNRIRKHDFYVGQSKTAPFAGYPFSFPNDTGYQECLRQSVESYSASGPGGAVQGEGELYGL